MTSVGKTRGILYRIARLLGWVQMVEDVAKGRPDQAGQRLFNKLWGRKVVRRMWWK